MSTLSTTLLLSQVSCGQMFTLAISQDGSQVFGWGNADNCSFGSPDNVGSTHSPVVSTKTMMFFTPVHQLLLNLVALHSCCVYIVAASSDSHGPICEGCVWEPVFSPPYN
jgi:alpha-tubulin suppressor-like RCC1 family protein